VHSDKMHFVAFENIGCGATDASKIHKAEPEIRADKTSREKKSEKKQ